MLRRGLINGGKNGKSSLEVYREYKGNREATLGIYDNGMGSGLLADARAGMLNTRGLQKKYTEELEDVCRVCGESGESMGHIILECEGLGGKRNIGIERALGLIGGDTSD